MNRIVTACMFLLILASQTAAKQKKSLTPTRKIVYRTIDKIDLQIHVFEPKGHKPADRRPAIVFFFGGGWVGGSPSQFYPHCEYLASRGMVAMSAAASRFRLCHFRFRP